MVSQWERTGMTSTATVLLLLQGMTDLNRVELGVVWHRQLDGAAPDGPEWYVQLQLR